ncbi:molybdopterin molybdenumtransferase MoeA [Siculibacillus lacustris]|uniref:Molybdopterin molybdenumtransferase n=1 Tax=Siculibacillus lacustris TaxID=1549641 RepID=A0A4Q9VQC9_9HYPH|nr:gephyrin-like molybdotransferase Glp [Siculibacillus lacustris]TBW37046.1 molybdopterin molybdenumtransferase MoeA [Siculibacillus lacustris]
MSPRKPLTPVETARAALLADVAPTPIERITLADAPGRVLAEDLAARRTQPPFDVSAMDGWAIRAADAAHPGAVLTAIGEAAAGRRAAVPVAAGEAVRIFTGAPMPVGADTVVVQEATRSEGDRVILGDAVTPGRNVRRAGADFRDGEIGLTAGTRLDFTNLGLIAAMNHAEIAVHRRPRVAILATGDELVAPGTEPGPDQIVASNGVGIAALVAAIGGVPVELGIVADRLDATVAVVTAALAGDVDVLVTIGGASVGDHDHVHAALGEAGVDIGFWKIAMRPGKPLMLGRRGRQRVIGLPGNPAASLVGAVVFLAPLVRALSGDRRPVVPFERAIAASDLAANDERQDYLRGTLGRDADGRTTVRPVDLQDSSLLSRFAAADALILRPPHAPVAPAGSPVEVLRLR